MLGLWSAGREYAVQDLVIFALTAVVGLVVILIVFWFWGSQSPVRWCVNWLYWRGVPPLHANQHSSTAPTMAVFITHCLSQQASKNKPKASKEPARWRKEPADKE